MTPLCALRKFLGRFPQLKAMTTQAGLARSLGKSESLVRAVESGRVPMSESFALQLATLFQVPLDWLMKKELSADEEIPPFRYDTPNGVSFSQRFPNELDRIAWVERLEDWMRRIDSPQSSRFPDPPPRRDPPPHLDPPPRRDPPPHLDPPPRRDPPLHIDSGASRYLMLRGKMIQDVLKGIHDHLDSCSDEELKDCLKELHEWTYSRLEKVAKDYTKGRVKSPKKDNTRNR